MRTYLFFRQHDRFKLGFGFTYLFDFVEFEFRQHAVNRGVADELQRSHFVVLRLCADAVAFGQFQQQAEAAAVQFVGAADHRIAVFIARFQAAGRGQLFFQQLIFQ